MKNKKEKKIPKPRIDSQVKVAKKTDKTHLDKEKTLARLQPFFERGLSVQKSCELAGFTASTVYRWLQDDPELAREVKGIQNIVTLNALTHKIKGVEKGDKSDVDWWLSRSKRIKDEFAERQELTGANGAALPTPIMQILEKGKEEEEEKE